ncbi:4-carboxymuconolactone decarboxylase [Noviherbaspirillum sp. CPCC 100848]|uniref:4-carboxymuconolactone decarboxylase n=1 Tax=Noviherbaspirillum album TaxID=3080276 RepID=A0ABU6J5E3_9BURK|nr:4-carboxymuconolactone decarboxylase [Noviherbaspirillum sp. CPCC 100848]MEC4718867.1 4-carboxymuconolactone decarboxylase [Noviherbaspirillum sp. CPCC 100848]
MDQQEGQQEGQRDQQYEGGLQKRRQVMGAEYVERAFANADEFSMPLQEFITRNAWGTVWCREGLDMKTRSLITVSMLTALGRSHELKGHLRGALNNGATPEELREVLLHAAVYCGAPLAVDAFRTAQEVVAEWRATRTQQAPG